MPIRRRAPGITLPRLYCVAGANHRSWRLRADAPLARDQPATELHAKGRHGRHRRLWDPAITACAKSAALNTAQRIAANLDISSLIRPGSDACCVLALGIRPCHLRHRALIIGSQCAVADVDAIGLKRTRRQNADHNGSDSRVSPQGDGQTK